MTLKDPLKEKRRGNARYFFTIQDREIQVCQKFFLETLGYTSNQVLKTAMKAAGEIGPISDKRGKGEAENRTKSEIIDSIVAHIKSFDPEISHYRRAHAPNRLYLPSTLSITNMYQNFLKENENQQVSYDVYRRELNRLNISLLNLVVSQIIVLSA